MSSCGHEKESFGVPLCAHLRQFRQTGLEYVKRYIGSGMDVELLCIPCAESYERCVPASVATVCEECFKQATTEVGDLVGVRGKPEIQERSEPFRAVLRETTLSAGVETIVDIAPLHDGTRSTWLMLAEDGSLIRLDAETLERVRIASSTVPPEPDHEAWNNRELRCRLHVSRSGEFGAVVNDYGHHGQIIDLQQGLVTLTLAGGDGYPHTVPFSFAFAHVRGRTIAIHRTDWNRLDISDPASGELLTSRGPTSYGRDEKRPAHYLDYFHGGLYVSPNSARILDDGWFWHPVGVPVTWSLDRWLFENVWESEDGPTRSDVCARDSYWDRAITWIDERRVAIGGIGDDDMDIIDGARIFDVTLPGKAGPRWRTDLKWSLEITAFAGPAGLFFSDGSSLFSSDETGLARWDPTDGARTGFLKDFQPTHYHPGAGEFVRVMGNTLLRYQVRG